MPAQTATDFRNLVTGSDFAATVVASGARYTGILTRGGAGALDVNDNRLRLKLVRADADLISLAASITVNGTAYTVREKEPDDQAVTLILETV